MFEVAFVLTLLSCIVVGIWLADEAFEGADRDNRIRARCALAGFLFGVLVTSMAAALVEKANADLKSVAVVDSDSIDEVE